MKDWRVRGENIKLVFLRRTSGETQSEVSHD